MRWLLLLAPAAGVLAIAMRNPGDARRRFALLDAKLDPSSLFQRVDTLERRVTDLERRG